MVDRRAFTLLEMIVVVGTVGILLALILPAVQSAREAGRRAQCAANLRQIGIAFSGYLAEHGVFPASAMNGRLPLAAFDTSAFSRILPWLEQQELYHSINFDIPLSPIDPTNAENATSVAVSLSVFLCPTDGGPFPPVTGAINYKINMGAGYYNIADCMRPEETGMFQHQVWVGPRDVRDGLSATALVSERLRGDQDPSRFNHDRDAWYAGFVRFTPYSTDEAVSFCSRLPSGVPTHMSTDGASWFRNEFGNVWYNHATGLNSRVPDCTDHSPERARRETSSSTGVYAARSYHAGGVQVLTADGSIHWVSGHIALPVWRALGTRAGQESLGTPFD